MAIGPRDKPSPLILHVNSATNAPAKIAEASSIYVTTVSAVTLSATTVIANNWVGLPAGLDGNLSGLYDVSVTTANVGAGKSLVWNGSRWQPSSVEGGVTDHGILTGLGDNDHPQYVLSSTNQSLSSLVVNLQSSANSISSTLSNHIASAVHWDLATLNNNYINTSGDSANASFFFQNLSATTFSATTYLNLPTSAGEAYNVVFLAKNQTGATINKGTPVAISGATGSNILITPLSSVNTHVPDATGFSNHVVGLAQVQITDGSTGHIITEGLLTGQGNGTAKLDTNAFNEGDILYVSSNGQLTNTRPPAPYESHPIGFVTRSHSNNGEIYVKIETQPEINDIVGFNLSRTTLTNGDLITYDLTTSTFINTQSINVSGSIKGGSVSATTVSATTYLNLPSGTATWNASALQGKTISTVTPVQSDILVYNSNQWTPSSVNFGGTINNNPGGNNYNIQFRNNSAFSGVDLTTYDPTTSTLKVVNYSGTNVTGATANFTTYLNLPTSSLSGQADTQITSPTAGQVLAWNSTKWAASSLPLGNYVLTSTNNALSSLVSNIQTSTTNLSSTVSNLQTSTLNLSTTLGNLQTSTTNLSSTVSNLQTSTLNLSTTLGNHLTSAVHWTLATLNSNYVNASGDNVTGAFYFENLSGATFSATTYLNLPTSSLSGLLDTTITTGNVGLGKALVWNGSKWQPSSISLSSLLDTSVGLNSYTAPSGGQALIYSSAVNKWYPGYTIYQNSAAPVAAIGRDGDIYLQYTDVDNSGALSSLTDTQITSPTAGQVLAWNNSDWVPSSITAGSPGAVAVGSNYRFQFYNNGSLSSVDFGYASSFGGSVSSNIPITTNVWAYVGQNMGVGQGLILYGPNGGGTAYLQNGPTGTSAVSANAFITPSLSATTISATTYQNLPSAVATWNASALQGTRLNLTPTSFALLGYNFGATEINAFTPDLVAIALNPEFSLSSLKDTQTWTNPTIGEVLKWNGSNWTPGAVGAGSPGGSSYQLQFNNAGSLSAVAGLEYVPELFGGPQLVLSGSVSRLFVTNSIYTQTLTADTQLLLGPNSAKLTSEASSTVKVLSSILVPSAIFFGSGIPSTATQPAGIYYTGQSVQNVPPAIYQCNQDNLNVYVNFTNNKAFRIVDQVAAAGGFAGSGYEFDGNSFIIQHGANTSATLSVVSDGVLQVVSSVSAVTVSANNLWNTIFKTSDQNITNTTVYTQDNDLKFSMAANKSYAYRVNLFFSSTANGDFKVSPSSTSTVFRNVMTRRTISPGATAFGNIIVSSTGTMNTVSSTVLQTITGPPGIVKLDGTITNGSSANTFYIMWSQNTADNLGFTTVMLGSYMDWKLLN